MAVEGANAVALPQVRRGREHLVDLERSEQIYLVIRDHEESPNYKPTPIAGGLEQRSDVTLSRTSCVPRHL